MIKKKYFVITDVHGSIKYFNEAIALFSKEKADVLVILGDLYYHGPRNPLPEGYNPSAVKDALLSIDAPHILIRGNCDAEVDEMITGEKFRKSAKIKSGNADILLEHGHNISITQKKSQKVNVVIYGHTHINDYSERDGVKYINIASLSMPKNGCERSYAVICDGIMVIKSINGNVIREVNL